jgi:hypothetical protein
VFRIKIKLKWLSNFGTPLSREVIARRSDAEPKPPPRDGESDLGFPVIEVLAKAPVLFRADARAEERQ